MRTALIGVSAFIITLFALLLITANIGKHDSGNNVTTNLTPGHTQ